MIWDNFLYGLPPALYTDKELRLAQKWNKRVFHQWRKTGGMQWRAQLRRQAGREVFPGKTSERKVGRQKLDAKGPSQSSEETPGWGAGPKQEPGSKAQFTARRLKDSRLMHQCEVMEIPRAGTGLLQ